MRRLKDWEDASAWLQGIVLGKTLVEESFTCRSILQEPVYRLVFNVPFNHVGSVFLRENYRIIVYFCFVRWLKFFLPNIKVWLWFIHPSCLHRWNPKESLSFSHSVGILYLMLFFPQQIKCASILSYFNFVFKDLSTAGNNTGLTILFVVKWTKLNFTLEV